MNAGTGQRSPLPARVALALLGLGCLLPFLSPVFYPPIQSFYGESVAFALGLAAVALLISRTLWTGVRLPRVVWLFVGFAALIALQIALGRVPYREVGLIGALYLLWAAALAVLANRLVQFFGAETFATVLAWFLFAGSLISAVIGLIQLLGIHTPLAPFMLPQIHGRIYANTGQPNHLASYLCLGAASAGYLWSTRRMPSLAALPACVVIVAVLAASGSRAVWLYAIALVAIAIVLLRLRPSIELKRLLLFAILLVGGLAAAQLAFAGLSAEQSSVAVETIGGRLQAQGMTSPVRQRFWEEAWTMFRAAPWLGVGFRQFAWNHFLLAARSPGAYPDDGIIDNAHNLVFHTAAEFGVCGLALLISGLAWWGWSLRRARIDAATWWMASALGVLGLHSMLEYPLWYAYFLGIAAMLMGAAENEAPVIDDRRSGRLAFLAAVVLGVFVFVGVFRDYRVMQSLQGAARPTDVAADGGDKRIAVLLDLQRTSLFAPFIEFALAQRMSLNQEHLKDKLVLNGRAMRFQPASEVVYRQAFLLAMSGDVAGMRALWDLAIASFPRDSAEALKSAERMEKSGDMTMTPLIEYARRQESKAEK